MKLRVVVGIVDSRNRSAEVRVGPAIDFSGGEKEHAEKWTAWLTVLCWIMAEPRGRST